MTNSRQKITCAIHQPQAFPWLGYFDKIKAADIFIFLDNVQFKKNEWQNRNRIANGDSWQWLTVPVIHNFGQPVSAVEINSTVRWQHKHLQAIRSNYGKAPFFKKYYPELDNIYKNDWSSLSAFSITLIRWGMEKLGISTPCRIASELTDFQSHFSADEKLIALCQTAGANVYLSGAGGHGYLDAKKFTEAGISVVYQEYSHPVYTRERFPFIANLSFLDYLFYTGKILP